MSRRTPVEDLREEESGADTPTRRRSSRIAAVVTTRRASASEDIPGKITKSKRLSLSLETGLERNDSGIPAHGPSTPQKKIVTRSASKSPSALSKIEETKDVPAMRTRRRASTSSVMDEETEKEERASPVLSKMTTRRLRSMSTSPTSEVSAGNSKPGTPRKSSRAISASPTNDLTNSAPPKLRGRRASVTEKIIPLEAIEETEAKTEEESATTDSNEIQTTEKNSPDEEKTASTIEETSDENLPFKKKKAVVSKKQNLHTIAEKIAEESESSIVDNKTENQETITEDKLDTGKNEETNSVNDKSLKESSEGNVTPTKNVETAEKNVVQYESALPETPESKPKTPKYSLSLRSKRSPGESVEEKELKAVLNVDREKQAPINSPRRSPRLSSSDSGNRDKVKQPLQTYTDTVNLTGGSEESFQLKLNLSQFDESQENLERQKAEEKSSLPTIVQEKDLNTSGSSNTSDKENHHQVKVPENVENILKKKPIVLNASFNIEKKSPHVEIISTPEETPSKQQKTRASRSSFYEPMEVEDYPPDYEYSGLAKKDENNKSPSKKLSEQFKSAKTTVIIDKSSKILESSKIVDVNASLIEETPNILKIDQTSTEKLKLLESPLEASPKQGSPTKTAKDTDKQNKSLSPIAKPTCNLTENDIFKIDISQLKAYSVTTELDKASSPKRRSARLLNQSKTENLEEEQMNVVNSTPNQKSIKTSISEDLQNSREVSVCNETTISVDELDLENTKDLQSPPRKELVKEDGVTNNVEVDKAANKSGKEESITYSNEASKTVNKSADKEIIGNSDLKELQEKEDQNKSIKGVVDMKNDSNPEVTEMEGEEIETSNFKNPQRKDAKNSSDEEDIEPKFSEDSDSDDIVKKDSSMERKSRGRPSSEQPRKSKGHSNDEEPEFVAGSDSGNSKKNLSKSDSILKNKSKDKKSSEQQEKSIEFDDEPKFSEDSDSGDVFKKDQSKRASSMKRKSRGRKTDASESDKEPKFSEESDSEDITKNDSTTRRKSRGKDSFVQSIKSIADQHDEDPKFSEDSDDEVLFMENRSKRESTSGNKQKGKGQSKINSDEEDEAQFSEDSDDDIKAPFLLYTIKPKKSVNPKPTKSASSEDNEKSVNKTKGKQQPSLTVRRPTTVLNSESDTENDNVTDLDLDEKINDLIANQPEEDSSSSSYESVTHFLDDLAEEGEEDTPSEGSNDIVDRGESIGSTESEIDSDESYENDSFIDDNGEVELLSGEEFDLGQEKKNKRPKRKHSRIITVSDSEEENKENELPAANKVDAKQPIEKVTNGIEEDSDLEKMSTRPYCGLTPPSVISLRDSLSDSEKIESKEVTSSVVINEEDNLQSLEALKQHEVSTDVLKTSTDGKKASSQLTPNAAQGIPIIFTPNNSILEDESTDSNKAARKRLSSITIHENIKLQDIAEGGVSDRISKVVDVFFSSVKEDEKDRCGNISLNISLEFLKSPSSPSKEDSVTELEENKEKSIENAVEKVLKKRRSSELINEPTPKPEEDIKLSAKKPKPAKNQDEFNLILVDQVSTKKRLSKEYLQKSSSAVDPEKQNETINLESSEGWETLSDDALPTKKTLSKKDRKKKRKQKNVSLTEMVDNKEKTEEKEEKQSNIAETIPSDSDMSEDLDAELNEKYSSNTSGELDITEVEAELVTVSKVKDKKSNKKKSAVTKQFQSGGDGEKAASEFVKKVKKRKRDKSENQGDDLIQITQENKSKKRKDKLKSQTQEESAAIVLEELKTSLKSDTFTDEVFLEEPHLTKKKKKNNKQKDKLMPHTEEESAAIALEELKTALKSDTFTDEVFLEEPHLTKKKKKSKKSPAAQIEPKNVADEPRYLKKKKEKVKLDKAGPSSGKSLSEEEESKFHYFPSRILNTLSKNDKLGKTEEMPSTSSQRKKPKLLPSSTMAKRSWTMDIVDAPVCPSKTSAKKMKMDVENVNQKDFKNLMLYDPSRVMRMDSKNLLKKKQKHKF